MDEPFVFDEKFDPVNDSSVSTMSNTSTSAMDSTYFVVLGDN